MGKCFAMPSWRLIHVRGTLPIQTIFHGPQISHRELHIALFIALYYRSAVESTFAQGQFESEAYVAELRCSVGLDQITRLVCQRAASWLGLDVKYPYTIASLFFVSQLGLEEVRVLTCYMLPVGLNYN